MHGYWEDNVVDINDKDEDIDEDKDEAENEDNDEDENNDEDEDEDEWRTYVFQDLKDFWCWSVHTSFKQRGAFRSHTLQSCVWKGERED